MDMVNGPTSPSWHCKTKIWPWAVKFQSQDLSTLLTPADPGQLSAPGGPAREEAPPSRVQGCLSPDNGRDRPPQRQPASCGTAHGLAAFCLQGRPLAPQPALPPLCGMLSPASCPAGAGLLPLTLLIQLLNSRRAELLHSELVEKLDTCKDNS